MGQIYLDKTIVWPKARWGSFGFALLFYILRVYLIQGFYVVSYGLGIYLLNLLIGFLSPAVDPDQDGLGEGETLLPERSDGEFRPFTRKLPEMKFWFAGMRAVVLSNILTLFSVFDLPVF